MSGGNLGKLHFHLGTLDRVREGALGLLPLDRQSKLPQDTQYNTVPSM